MSPTITAKNTILDANPYILLNLPSMQQERSNMLSGMKNWSMEISSHIGRVLAGQKKRNIYIASSVPNNPMTMFPTAGFCSKSKSSANLLFVFFG